jgi:hypothetical protein
MADINTEKDTSSSSSITSSSSNTVSNMTSGPLVELRRWAPVALWSDYDQLAICFIHQLISIPSNSFYSIFYDLYIQGMGFAGR